MYKFIGKNAIGDIVMSNDSGEEIFVNNMESNGKHPIVSSYDWNLDLKKVIDAGIIETPYGNIDFTSGFIYKRHDFKCPIVSSLLNYKVNTFPNIDTFQLLRDMYLSPYENKAFDLLNISNLNEIERQKFISATFPLKIGIEFANIPKFMPRDSEKSVENTIKFVGIDENNGLNFKFNVMTPLGLKCGIFSISEVILSMIYQGIYMPIIVFQDNIEASVLKMVIELIFKNKALLLGDKIGNIATENGIKILVNGRTIPMFPNATNETENLFYLTEKYEINNELSYESMNDRRKNV